MKISYAVPILLLILAILSSVYVFRIYWPKPPSTQEGILISESHQESWNREENPQEKTRQQIRIEQATARFRTSEDVEQINDSRFRYGHAELGISFEFEGDSDNNFLYDRIGGAPLYFDGTEAVEDFDREMVTVYGGGTVSYVWSSEFAKHPPEVGFDSLWIVLAMIARNDVLEEFCDEEEITLCFVQMNQYGEKYVSFLYDAGLPTALKGFAFVNKKNDKFKFWVTGVEFVSRQDVVEINTDSPIQVKTLQFIE